MLLKTTPHLQTKKQYSIQIIQQYYSCSTAVYQQYILNLDHTSTRVVVPTAVLDLVNFGTVPVSKGVRKNQKSNLYSRLCSEVQIQLFVCTNYFLLQHILFVTGIFLSRVSIDSNTSCCVILIILNLVILNLHVDLLEQY